LLGNVQKLFLFVQGLQHTVAGYIALCGLCVASRLQMLLTHHNTACRALSQSSLKHDLQALLQCHWSVIAASVGVGLPLLPTVRINHQRLMIAAL
jgi:hypothetical protein